MIIAWTDAQGSERYAQANCREISRAGLRIELSQPIPYLSHVTLRLEGMSLATSARVRHVRTRGLTAVVGLELSEPLRDRLMEAISASKVP